MNGEYLRIWKEEIVGYFRVLLMYLNGGPRLEPGPSLPEYKWRVEDNWFDYHLVTSMY